MCCLHVDFVKGISVNKYWNNQFELAIQHNPNINGEGPECTLNKYLLQHHGKKKERSIFSVQNSLRLIQMQEKCAFEQSYSVV